MTDLATLIHAIDAGVICALFVEVFLGGANRVRIETEEDWL